jgi:ABC-type transport system involved in cytochrome c biogenesis permease subunit
MSTTIAAPTATGSAPQPRRELSPPLQVLKALASLQLTVALFALSVALVFFGTVAQMDNGIWTVVDKYFWSWYVMVPLDLFHKMGTVFLSEHFSKDAPPWGGSFPFPAGKLLGGLMLVNLLAAHATRFRFTWKRSGVLVLHAGLILLFVGEFITREFAVEQRMTIDEGSAVGFTESSRKYELAVIDRSNPSEDKVTAIPASRLADAEVTIKDAQLPVDIRVEKYWANSRLKDVEPGKKNPATAGLAVKPRTAAIAVEAPPVSGVDPNQTIDLPSAYVTLYKKGTDESLGTFLVSLLYSTQKLSNEFTLDGKKFELSLRFTRYYKPYRVELEKFRFDRYPGTQKPKNYSSDVKVFDESGALVREQTIRMNEPMRYAGETFYQQSFERSETTTILQVVKNPGWVLPYVSCTMVGVGLIMHFLVVLIGFLTKMRAQKPAAAADADATAAPADAHGEPPARESWMRRNFTWFIPAAVVTACVLYLGGVMGRMKPKDNYDIDTFAKLPVLDGGRIKPLDSVARVWLRKISHKSDFVDEKGNEHPAIRWYLDTLGAEPTDMSEPAWQYPIIRIESDQVIHELKLPMREGLRYSWKEIFEKFDDIRDRSDKIMAKKRGGKPLEPAEVKMLDLAEKMDLLMKVARGAGADTEKAQFHLVPPLPGSETWQSYAKVRRDIDDETYTAAVKAARTRVAAQPGGWDQVADEFLIQKFFGAAANQIPPQNKNMFLQMAKDGDPKKFPPDFRDKVLSAITGLVPQADQDDLRAKYEADKKARDTSNPGMAEWDNLINLRKAKKFTEWNEAVAKYRDDHAGLITAQKKAHLAVELNYNRFAPFLRCIGLYVIAFLLSVFGFAFKAAEWPQLGEAIRKSSIGVLLLAFLVHVVGLFVRMDLMNYTLVFVTNLYSSAIFIGAGCVALGLVLERLFPIGIAAIVASVLGVATTIVAHNLATEDTLEMMEAVLDTNFWLATHVTTVTLGYTATFVAGFLAAAYAFLMFCSVVRDSFHTPGPPSPDRLFAYGAASLGIVFLPMSIGWVLFDALGKFEVIPGILGELTRYAMIAVAGVYFVVLLVSRAGADGVDAHGKPVPTPVPKFAQPVVAMGLTPNLTKVLGQMIYGVIAFATVLSFIGTVLGGIWADQSWGRFWGWDPKENGAVLIVLWNALILHARWCGLVKTRGIAVLAILGNIITAWSWFGTNQLGIGLHAYGFDTRLADGCTNFWFSMSVIAAIGLIPSRFWSGTPAASPVSADVKPRKRK